MHLFQETLILGKRKFAPPYDANYYCLRQIIDFNQAFMLGKDEVSETLSPVDLFFSCLPNRR
jgi:hypothetical protein